MKKQLIMMSMLATLAAQTAKSEENLWVYTKGTDTRPQGSYELKLSNITRLDKGSGQYTFHDIRPEIEYGITDHFTVGAELLFFDHDYSVDDEIGPMNETQEDEPNGRFQKTQFAGYELAAKYNVLSPYKDALGLSFGLGYERRLRYRLDGAKINQHSYTGTVLLQKNWLDDTLVLAFNGKTELERRKSGSVLEEEIAFDLSAGISYRTAPKHFIGLEIRSQSDYLNPQDYSEAGNSADGYDEKGYSADLQRSSWDLSDFRLGTQHQIGTYFGPTYHYAEKNWWITTGILFQIAGGGSQHSYRSNGKNFDEHERVHIGLTYGYEF
jgi:hypothetical protein